MMPFSDDHMSLRKPKSHVASFLGDSDSLLPPFKGWLNPISARRQVKITSFYYSTETKKRQHLGIDKFP